jgi:uncharacterized membrane protein YagU involved in acid resistance
MGLGATLLMDAWHLLLRSAFGVASMNYCVLGRWSPRAQCLIGWAMHYSIGIILAVAFLLLAPAGWLASPTLTLPLAFGVVTVVLPFFILQPALGLGVAASKAPHPWRARLKSLGTHLVFGAGLYLCARLFGGAYSL